MFTIIFPLLVVIAFISFLVKKVFKSKTSKREKQLAAQVAAYKKKEADDLHRRAKKIRAERARS